VASNGRLLPVRTLHTSSNDRNNSSTKPPDGRVLTDLLPFPHDHLCSPGTRISSYGGSQYNSKINFYCVQFQHVSVTLCYALRLTTGKSRLDPFCGKRRFKQRLPQSYLDITHIKFYRMSRLLTFLLCIRKVPYSNLGPETGYREFCGFTQSLQANTGMVP
jgi:hypothetical protein